MLRVRSFSRTTSTSLLQNLHAPLLLQLLFSISSLSPQPYWPTTTGASTGTLRVPENSSSSEGLGITGCCLSCICIWRGVVAEEDGIGVGKRGLNL